MGGNLAEKDTDFLAVFRVLQYHMKIAVLGAGMVGSAIALDLSKSHVVAVCDINPSNLSRIEERDPSIVTKVVNLKNQEHYDWLEPFDIVVTAVPGFMGYSTLEKVIRAKKNVVDISFFPENSLELDTLAKEMGVTAITDCGIAPGMSNFIFGHYDKRMKIHSFECYVGGLPLNPVPPFNYKAPFSPVDVIQEYVRPARFVKNGELVTVPALTGIEEVEFSDIHLLERNLEAFNTDGLRSLVYTMSHVPYMIEKTVRYAGHAHLINALAKAGMFSEKVTSFGISPFHFTSMLLIDEWKLGPEEHEFTVMKVVVKEDRGKIVHYEMYDEYDSVTKTSSMARTTGYTCNAAVELVLQKKFTKTGIFPPELVSRDSEVLEFVLQYLADRNVVWKCQTSS
jgi:saccharopine dehydrogenase-like NADP-dependent oxidoreductase